MRIALTILLLIIANLSFPQCHVSGWIFTGSIEEKVDLPFAQIYFNNPDDTTSIVHSTLTDLEGLYYLGLVRPGDYFVYSEKDGYTRRTAKLTVPINQLVWKTNFLLHKKNDQRQGIASVNYPIGQLTKSRRITDILNCIPGMTFDDKKLVLSAKEGEVMIMLDGGFQLPDKVKDIQTRRIKSIDCYTIETGGRNRYAKAIDIITR